MNLMYSHSLLPLITRPTRVAENSISLIDNIFSLNPKSVVSGIIPTDISDHYLVFSIFENFFITVDPRIARTLFALGTLVVMLSKLCQVRCPL